LASSDAGLDAFDAILSPAPAPSASTHGAARTEDSRSERPLSSEARLRAEASVQATPRVADFLANLELYRDPIACAVLAGAGLGALGVFAVLRRAIS
jgi:hypothetical protein